MINLFKKIIAGSIGLLKWAVGLIALAVVGILVYRLYAPAQWRCLLDTGAYILTVGGRGQGRYALPARPHPGMR